MAIYKATGGKADVSPSGSGYTNIPNVRTWTLTINPDSKEYASSSTNGAKARLAGNENSSGTITIYDDDTAPPESGALNIKAGTSMWFKLYKTAAKFYLVPAYVESVETTTDIEGGEIEAVTINFTQDGSLGTGLIVYPT
jgi:hypothetical protein